MNKKGVALIFGLLVITVLAVLSSSMYMKSINEVNLVKRYVYSTEAFWLAETAVAEAIRNLPNSVAGSIKTNYNYSATTAALLNPYYQIDATGTVSLPLLGINITRSIRSIVKTKNPSPSKFPHAIETTGNLIRKGNAYTIDGTVNEHAILNFSDKFEITKAEMESYATHLYDENTFGEPIDGITWVDVSSDSQLTIAGTLQGDGIIIVSGDLHISGDFEFYGIIYVIGELFLSGNPEINGSIVAESGADIDSTVVGHVTVNHDVDAIDDALKLLTLLSPEIASWQEI